VCVSLCILKWLCSGYAPNLWQLQCLHYLARGQIVRAISAIVHSEQQMHLSVDHAECEREILTKVNLLIHLTDPSAIFTERKCETAQLITRTGLRF
jgi:hypothetical protein